MPTMRRLQYAPEKKKEAAATIANALLEVPYDLREKLFYTVCRDVTQQLVKELPAADAKPIKDTLAGLDGIVVRINTVKEKMRYDIREFTVRAGKPVTILFHNPDYADHNLFIVTPGSTEIVGNLAAQLGAAGVKMEWRPKTDRILHGTGLLSSGKSETLKFTAPPKPDTYEYVCTFPGHWMMMRGFMYVIP